MNSDPMRTPAELPAALLAWSALLGAENVLSDPATLAAQARTTLPSAPQPIAILRPSSAGEVTEAVRIAARFGVPLYPISTGRNWGYGDGCPTTEGQAIIDLGRMNRVLEVNEELAYCVIEPGVTQGQLAEHLRGHAPGLWLDCTGAGPDTSVIGNIVERGFGHTAYGNRFQFICGMQVVLADGRVLETGFGHYAVAKVARLFSGGLGPALDGLFTQSNLGIVTRLGLWLMPAPEHIEMFVCIVDRHDGIAPVVDALRRLRLAGTVRSVVHIASDMRLISSNRTFPWQLADGSAPLTTAVRDQLRTEAGTGAWALSGNLTGGKREVAAARARLKRTLKGPGRKLVVFSERTLTLGTFVLRWFGFGRRARGLLQRLRSAQAVFELNRGQPTGTFLAGAYWRRRAGLPPGFPRTANPAHDGCGMMWLSPVVPMTGAAVLAFCRLVEPIYEEYGFEFLLTLSAVTDRALGAVMTVAYDRDSAEETRRAEACYRTLLRAVMDAGYIPYRIGIQSMAELQRGSSVFWDVASSLKAALDPQGIIAPGRYEPAVASKRANRSS